MTTASGKTFFGNPPGLATLFFTEMWERFSYYGMRALLFLFMVASVEKGGLGLDDKTSGAIYGLYTMFVYLLALPGGWLADRYFGLRKSVFYGGCLIAAGHLSMAIPFTETFFLGLLLIVIGTGLLKPNISSLVGTLYSPDDQARRDAGFSIFFMGINIGAMVSPIIVGYLGEKISWHVGFGSAGVGMLLGLVIFKLTESNLGDAGLAPSGLSDPLAQMQRKRNITQGLWATAAILVLFIAMLFLRLIRIDPVAIATASSYVIGITVAVYFVYVFLFEKLESAEKKKVLTLAIFFLASATFYSGFEQQGSSLNLFADRYADMVIAGYRIPTSWLQTFPPAAVVLFAPIFAWLWIRLAKKNLNPSTPVKLSLGLIFMGLGYTVMVAASTLVVAGQHPLPTWLIFTFVLQEFGEICLYPVGLSAVTKLAPGRLVGQMMGIWFMSLAFGNLIAGVFAGEFDAKAISDNPQLLVDLFWFVAKFMFIAGFIVLLISKPIRKLMGDIH